MRYVVTGSGGFLGRYVCRRLSEGNDDVVGILRPDSAAGHPWAAELPGFRFHRASLDEPGRLLPKNWRDNEPFILIHLAWDVHSRSHFGRQARHVSRLADLLDRWTAQGLAGLVVAGSADEYGQRPGRLHEEDEPRGRLSAYGWAKRAARQLTEQCSAQTGTGAVWLRPFTVYGPEQSGDMLVPYAVRRLLAGQPVELTHGWQQRDFVHVDDVAQAFAIAARRLASSSYHSTGNATPRRRKLETFNVGSGIPVSVREVLSRIVRFGGSDGKLLQWGALPSRAGEPDVQIASPDRAFQRLGWRPTVSLDDGLLQVVKRARKETRWTA